MTATRNTQHQRFVVKPGNAEVCYVLDENALNAVSRLLKSYGIEFYVRVYTDSREYHYENIEDFYNWVNRPHIQIQAVTLVSPKDSNGTSTYIYFGTSRSNSAINWKIVGLENEVEAIDVGIKETVKQIKRPYSIIYAGEIKNLLLNGLCILIILIPLAVTFTWSVEKWLFFNANQTQHFRLPNGEMLSLIPLMPVEEPHSPFFWTKYLFYIYVLAVTTLILRVVRPFYPIGMFEIGFEAGRIRRRSALQTNIFWGGAIAFLIAIITPVILSVFFSS